MDAIRNRGEEGRDGVVRLNAGMVEGAVLRELRKLLRTPEVASRAITEARQQGAKIDDNVVVTSLTEFDGVWESLFPAEQARIARLLINRVVVSQAGLMLDLRTEGLGSLVRDMLTPRQEAKAA
jgi:site-specific DNA recombinase